MPIAILLNGCVTHTAYQVIADPPSSIPKSFELATIEFDDHGERWAQDQVDAALEAVDKASGGLEHPLQENGAIVVVFIHGWKHNAHSDDGNRLSFERLLKGLADGESARPLPRKILGLYIGWRGDSLALPDPIKTLSFYDRYTAAARVASPSMTELLFAVMKVVRRNSNSRCILVGHSMGGLILQRAVAQAFVGLIAERAVDVALDYYERARRGEEEVSRDQVGLLTTGYKPPADLIILVNSAAPAIDSKQFVDILKELDFRYYFSSREAAEEAKRKLAPFLTDTSDVASWRPFMLSVTSDGDWATGKIFPIGMAIDRIGKRFRKEYEANISDREWPHGYPTQRELYIRTAGFVSALHSHDVDVQSVQQSPSAPSIVAPCPDLARGSDAIDQLCFQSGGKRFVVTRKPTLQPQRTDGSVPVATFNTTPYWILRVPTGVINDHNDIFNDAFVDFLRGVIGVAAELHEAQSGPRWPLADD